MFCSEVCGYGSTDGVAVDDDLRGRDVAGLGEVVPGGLGVFVDSGFGRKGAGAVAVASVVEEEDVVAELVELQGLADVCADVDGVVVEVKEGGGVGLVGRNPPGV